MHKNYRLVGKEEKKVERYNIKKTIGEGSVVFTASTDKEFNEADKKNWFLGISNCKDSFIDSVRVSSDGANLGGGNDESGLNALRCGIGTILSPILMIDTDVNP